MGWGNLQKFFKIAVAMVSASLKSVFVRGHATFTHMHAWRDHGLSKKGQNVASADENRDEYEKV